MAKKNNKDESTGVDQRLDAVESAFGEMAKSISEILKNQNEERQKAKNNPMVGMSPQGYDSRRFMEGADNQGDLKFTQPSPDGAIDRIRPGLHAVQGAELKDKVEQLEFSEQMIQVMVHPAGGERPEHTGTVSVNGKKVCFKRGVPQWMSRAHVEVLAKAKTSDYGNVETVNPYNGEKTIQNPETRTPRYPFHVLQDPSPLGAQWLHRVTNEYS